MFVQIRLIQVITRFLKSVYSHSIEKHFLPHENDWYDWFLSIKKFRNKLATNRHSIFVSSQLIIFDNSTPVFHRFHPSLCHHFLVIKTLPFFNYYFLKRQSNFDFTYKFNTNILITKTIFQHNERFWRSIQRKKEKNSKE